MKMLQDSYGECKLACDESWTSGNQASMSKENDNSNCEYWWRLWEHRRRGAISFHRLGG